MKKEWYVLLSNNEQKGPMSEVEVGQLIESRAVGESNYCWCADLKDWVPLREVPMFAAKFAAPQEAGVQEGWSGLRDVVDRGKRGAIRAMKLAKLKMRLANLKQTRQKYCAALGEAIYAKRGELTLPDSAQYHVESIKKCDEDIASVEKEMRQIESDAS